MKTLNNFYLNSALNLIHFTALCSHRGHSFYYAVSWVILSWLVRKVFWLLGLGVYSVSNIIQHAPWTRKISETISLFRLPFVNYFRLPPMPSVRRARQCTLFPVVKNCSKSMRTNFSGEKLMWLLMIFRFSIVTHVNRFKHDHQKSFPWLIIFGGQQYLLFSLQGSTHFFLRLPLQ